jgi:cystathionine beta-lyase
MYDFNNAVDRNNSNAEKYRLKEKLFHTNDLLPMWVADMDIETPPFIFEDIQKRLTHPVLGYEEFPNSAKLAQKKWILESHGYDIDENNIIFSPSVVTSINVAIKALTQVDDEVIVQTPVYFPFMSSITNNKRKILKNPLKKTAGNDYTFDLDDLRSKITPKTKLLLLCSPHNPVGRVWEKQELQALADICIEHDIKVFADEIHSDLVFKGSKHIPFASLGKEAEDLTITAYGVGKTFNLAGIATSTVIIQNKKLREIFLEEYEAIHFAQGNILGHVAFESAYTKGKIWKEELLGHLEKNITLLEKMLQNHKNKILFKRPQGTYLAWLDCSLMNMNDKTLRQFLIKEAKLGLSPGITFGKEGSGYMRLNFAVPYSTMEKAVNQLDKALNKC